MPVRASSRYKGKAPSAYCDCMEQGLCVATPPRRRSAERTRLIDRLLAIKDVAVAKNSEGVTALFTLATQMPHISGFKETGTPLHPQTFDEELAERTRVLGALAQNWDVVLATLLTGHQSDASAMMAEEEEEGGNLQDNTVQLDHFTYQVVSNGSVMMVGLLIRTINQAIATDSNQTAVACRFVRSVVRVFTVLSSGDVSDEHQKAAINVEEEDRKSKRGATEGTYTADSPALLVCRTIFNAFPALAIQELAENADAIVSPVRIGLVRPHASFGAEQSVRGSAQTSSFSYHYPVDDPDEVFSLLELGKPAITFREDESEPESESEEADSAARSQAPGDTERELAGGVNGDGEVRSSAAGYSLEWATRQFQLSKQDKRGGRRYESAGPGFASRHGHGKEPHGSSTVVRVEREIITMEYLSRLYSRLVKAALDIVGACNTVQPSKTCEEQVWSTSGPAGGMKMPDPEGCLLRQARLVLEQQLERTWVWLVSVLDSLEAQLLVGAKYVVRHSFIFKRPFEFRISNFYLCLVVLVYWLKVHSHTGYTDACRYATTMTVPSSTAEPGTQSTPGAKSEPRSEGRKSRRRRKESDKALALPLGQLNFRQYLLTLMRGHSGEHGGSMPEVDVSSTQVRFRIRCVIFLWCITDCRIVH